MRKFILLSMGIMMLGLFSCEKEIVCQEDHGTEVTSKRPLPPPPANCGTALMIQGMTPSSSTCSVTDLTTGLNVVTFGNGTAYPTLQTSRSYFVDIQGPSAATFSWCSCGNNIGSVTIPAGGYYILTTSSNGSNYTICSF